VADPGGLAVAVDTRAEEGARVAWDGTNFMVVWQHDHYPNVWNVRGARVSPGSGVIDTIGIDICTDPLNQKNAALAFDGQRYQVVWSGQKNGPTYDYDIAGARVSTQGQLLPNSKVTVAATPQNQLVPAVAAGGGTFLAVWQDKRAGSYKNDIYAARIGQ
jgi:hypothetical protein